MRKKSSGNNSDKVIQVDFREDEIKEAYFIQEKGEADSKPESKIEQKVDPEDHQSPPKDSKPLPDVEPAVMYLKVLINFRDKAQDKSVEDEFEFKCLFRLFFQIIS